MRESFIADNATHVERMFKALHEQPMRKVYIEVGDALIPNVHGEDVHGSRLDPHPSRESLPRAVRRGWVREDSLRLGVCCLCGSASPSYRWLADAVLQGQPG